MHKLLSFYILLLVLGTSINLPLFGKEIQLADFFFISILVRLIWSIKRGSRVELLKPLFMVRNLIVVLLVLLLVACGFSSNGVKSLVEFAAIGYLAILYLWVAGMHMDEQRLKSILHFWLYFSGGLCILALGGLISYAVFGRNNQFIQIYPEMKSVIPFARLSATFPTMNMFASFLHVGIVFLLAVIAFEGWRQRYILLSGLILTCAFLTASRNLLGIFITIFLAILPIKARPVLSIFKYVAFGVTVLLLFLVLITTVWCVFPAQMNYDRQNHTFSLSINTSPSLYAILNRMSIRFIKQNFWVGIGPGTLNQTLVEQADWDEAKDTYKAKGFDNRNAFLDPHNTYLGWAAEVGLPFVLVMLGLLYSIVHLLWKGYKASSSSFTGGFCYICMCGIIGFIVNGLYIDIFTMRHFWIMMALGTLEAARCLKSQTVGVTDS